MPKLRWGLLSTARINRHLIPAIRVSKRGELVAVASRNHTRAKEYAKEWNIPHAYQSYEAMLDSDQIDIVYISLPNHLHSEWSIRALESGKHVLCEKPLALSLEQVDRMTHASRTANRVLAEAFMYRHHPQIKIIRDWVEQGALGKVFLIQGVFTFQIRNRNDIRLMPEYGGGSLWDVGVYPLSLAQHIFGGPPESVSAQQWIGASGVDETFSGLLNYSAGRAAQIASSFNSPRYTRVEIIGTSGRLVLTSPFNPADIPDPRVFHYSENGTESELIIPDFNLYLGEVEDLHRAILDGEPTTISLDESRDHIRTVLALYQAASTHSQVSIR